MSRKEDEVSKFFQSVVSEDVEDDSPKIIIPDRFLQFLNFTIYTCNRCMDTRFGAGLREILVTVSSQTREFASIIPSNLRGAAAVGFGSALIVDVGFIFPTLFRTESLISPQLTIIGALGLGSAISRFWQEYS